MKRFWRDVSVVPAEGGWRVALDGRPVRTQGGAAQIVPTQRLAEALADEWRAQDEDVDPRGFPLRDMANFALDQVLPEREATIQRVLAYAETDTLCYRADPDEPLYRRQLALWEPLLTPAEALHGIKLERVSGIVHRAQPPATLARLRTILEEQDSFTLAALATLAPLAASLTIALAAPDPDADTAALFAAANCEQDWQAELWGWEAEAEANRAARLESFEAAARFARLSAAG